MTETFSMQIIM